MGSILSDSSLLTHLVDKLASDTPDLLYCIHAVNSKSEKDGWRNVTFKLLSQAVDRLSWWIDEKLSGKHGQHVLAYIGTNDLRYVAFILACMKTGNTALLLSTRNSQLASLHLLKETGCSVLVDGSETPQLRKSLDDLQTQSSGFSLQRWYMDSIWDIFSHTPVQSFLHTVRYEDVEDHVPIIIHSSGTTGLPKPVNVSHGYLATILHMETLPIPENRKSGQLFLHYKGHLRFHYGPMFHFVGLVCMVECIFFATPFLLAPDKPLTTDVFTHIMNLEPFPKWGLVTPFILEELAASQKGRDALARLSGLNFGGAPMARATGDTISGLVLLQSMFGSSETSYTPILLCEDPGDWDYFEWNPAFSTRMEEVDNGLWELILPRGPDSRYYHGVFHTYPELTQYRTGDLFQAHPSKAGLWHYEGRADDIIVLSNGEKFNPVDAEKLIQSHSLVDHAAVFGQDRFQAGIIVEPKWMELPPGWTIEWLHQVIKPVLAQANAALPAHARILDSHVRFSSPDQPFDLSPKGTLRRRDIFKKYSVVIDEVYSPVDVEFRSPDQLPQLVGSTIDDIEDWLQTVVAKITSLDTINLEDDISALGTDSLQVVRLVQALQETTKLAPTAERHNVWTSAQIYELATVRNVAARLFRQLSSEASQGSLTSQPEWSQRDLMTRFTWQQAQFLQEGGITVILTGSTGELGTFLLHQMLQDPSVLQIYCLNRTSDAAERQRAAMKRRRLQSAWLTDTSRVKFLKSSLDQENLGLELADYNLLLLQADVIVHNAWSVNFNQSLSTFESQITGVRRLLEFSHNSHRNADFHFVSSIATVSAQTTDEGPLILEAIQSSSSVLAQGYGQSKFVAESLCAIAARRKKARIAIHRVGQLGGPSAITAGMWSSRDWFPALVRSSCTMGTLPDSLGPLKVDWLPIDIAAQVMCDIIEFRREAQPSGLCIYHITNPKVASWDDLSGVLAQACGAKIVPLNQWVGELQHQALDYTPQSRLIEQLPAIQLLDFFNMLLEQREQILPGIDGTNSSIASATFRGIGAVDENLMKIWLNQWKEWIPEIDLERI
ncbi:Male sterility, NAD-binding [Penicillium italicum]|uniref:Male sterility, NAD-binding n=1 Tax=Penicillium italicum TaxID=40296 RepID=A0A0A2KIE8_PENIT|nr:Male sterility, NAD-binding [Penicillium italicum]